MAVCPECWKNKPLLSPRCPNCNQEVSIGDTFGLTVALWLGKNLIGLFILLFILGSIFG